LIIAYIGPAFRAEPEGGCLELLGRVVLWLAFFGVLVFGLAYFFTR
jgi:hypothetical protein